MAPSTSPSLRILMLHGFTNSGAIFRAKTRALEKSIQKAFPRSTLTYVDGPHRLKPSDIPGYPGSPLDPRTGESDDTEIESFAWWRRKDPPEGSSDPIVYAGIDDGVRRIADAIRTDGPFDGVIGFSQGACAAAITASLLEGRRRHDAMTAARATDGRKMPYPDALIVNSNGNDDASFIQSPLKFAVIYSGFPAPPDVYGALYSPPLTTPTLHVIGSLDTIVDEDRSRSLIDRCENPAVFVHPGGHFCPSTREGLEAVTGFIKSVILDGGNDIETRNRAGDTSRGLGNDRVEDMDVPF